MVNKDLTEAQLHPEIAQDRLVNEIETKTRAKKITDMVNDII